MSKEDLLKKIDEIIEKSKKIDPKTIAIEVLTWLNTNVEMFIENTTKSFKLDLIIDDDSKMPEAKKLQDLYREIPDDEEAKKFPDILEKLGETRGILDQITSQAYDMMTKQEEKLEGLFKRMIFYYEKIVPNPENKKKAKLIDEKLKNLILSKDQCKNDQEKQEIQKKITETIKEGEALIKYDELDGTVSILKFEYEAFDVAVSINKGMSNINEESGEIEEDQNKKTIKSYVIPESFTIWIQLSTKIKQRPTNLF